MPPFVNGKRREPSSEPESPPSKRRKTTGPTPTTKATGKRKPKAPKVRTVATKIERKSTLFDVADSSRSHSKPGTSKFFAQTDGSDESDLSSDADSDEFENVVPEEHNRAEQEDEEDEDEEQEDNAAWEDALHVPEQADTGDEELGEALELNLGGPRPAAVTYADLTGGKKQGPSKKDKQMRVLAHSIHVQYLMWHNHIRNHWLKDWEVQSIMVEHMQKSQKMQVQYESWKKRSGIIPEAEKHPTRKSIAGVRNSGKRKGNRSERSDPRSERDWGRPAERQAIGEPDMSRGDPLQQFLNVLAAWWKQKFTITAPGLRKRGYKPVKDLKEELQTWRKGESGVKEHGERIANLQEFRAHAKRCEGSRDVGAQLFVALLRGLGIESRMVSSLQPLGYGWTKYEDAEMTVNKTTTAADKIKKTKQGIEKQTNMKNKQKDNDSKVKAISLSDTSDLSELPDAKDEDDESDASIIDITPKKRPNMPYDRDLLFPSCWTEAISSLTHKVFPVDPFWLQPAVASGSEQLMLFEARGAKAEKARQVFAYVVAFSADNTAKDVTIRYLKKHIWPGKTKGFRLSSAKIPVHNRHGRVRGYYEVDWWQSVLRPYLRPGPKRTIADDLEDQSDLKAVQPEKKAPKEGVPDTLDGFKRSTEYVLARHLRREEALLPAAETVQTFKTGKGGKATEEPVYLRKDVATCRTSESWHKEGRQVKVGEQPLKMVPIRAVTLTRKREIEETERETGEKAMQGMYGKDQTEWIIPAPIQNGMIPKNSYGNMDAFVPQMIPKGAVHIPLRGTVKICKKLEIDYAEAVTGFEFGNKMAVPVIEGVVVAEEHENRVIDAWERAEEERQVREAAKQEKLVLSTWRKFLMGLRIMERMRDEYEINIDDNEREKINPFVNPNRQPKEAIANGGTRTQEYPVRQRGADAPEEAEMATGFLGEDEAAFGGGFLPEGHEAEILEHRRPAKDGEHTATQGGFLLEADEEAHGTLQPVKQGAIRSLADLAAQRTHTEPDDSEEQEEDLEEVVNETPMKPKLKKRKPRVSEKPAEKTPAKRTPKRRGRPSKAQLDGHDEDGEAELPLDPLLGLSTPSDSASVLPANASSSRATRASTRSAAKAGQKKIRSHFFESDSQIGSAEDVEDAMSDTRTPASRVVKRKERR